MSYLRSDQDIKTTRLSLMRRQNPIPKYKINDKDEKCLIKIR